MATLGSIDRVEQNITKAPVKAVRVLHRMVYGREGDRQNRKRLRQFQGFAFEADTDDYRNKILELENFQDNDLVTVCTLLCLDYTGTKADLITRIMDGLRDLRIIKEAARKEEDDEEEVSGGDDEFGDDDDDSEAGNSGQDGNPERQPAMRKTESQFSFHFRDIENTVRPFEGSTGLSVRRWIDEFEETATLFKWNEMQKLIFGKKSLTGIAKLYVQSETDITTWKKLKTALIEEFDVRITDADIHRQLAKRRHQKEETIQQYFLIMKEIASRGNIADDSLMEYIIDGIDDDGSDKTILYGAETIKEFKVKLCHFEKMRGKIISKTAKDKERKKLPDKDAQNRSKDKGKCYNCGKPNHKSADCRNKTKGRKCFKCNKFGHIASECGKTKGVEKDSASTNATVNNVTQLVRTQLSRMRIAVSMENKDFEALVDTGLHLNLLREDVHQSIGEPNLKKTDVRLLGFGRSCILPRGYFTTRLIIDKDDFETDFYVVSNDVMKFPIMLGNDLLEQAELIVNRSGVQILKSKPDSAYSCY